MSTLFCDNVDFLFSRITIYGILLSLYVLLFTCIYVNTFCKFSDIFCKFPEEIFFNCIYVFAYWIYIYYSSMFTYCVVCQIYHMSYWLFAKNSIILSIVFRQCSSCFVDISIMLEMVLQVGCLKLTKPYYNG